MKILSAMAILIFSLSATATVIELDEKTTRRVREVYEEMREEEVDAGENGWIHEFESDSVGAEMDHLSIVGRPNKHETKNQRRTQ